MFLQDIKEGNLFEYTVDSKIVLRAIRCKSIRFPHIIPCLGVTSYFLLNKDTKVYEVCDTSSFESGLDGKMVTKLLPPLVPNKITEVKAGRIAQICTPNGQMQWVLITKHISYGAKVVASVNSISSLQSGTQIIDMGDAGEFNGIPDYNKETRACPNCLQYTLVETKRDEVGYNVSCDCLYCGIKVALSWGKD